MAQSGFRSYLHALTKDQVGEWEDIWYDFDEVMQEEADRYAKANQEQEWKQRIRLLPIKKTAF